MQGRETQQLYQLDHVIPLIDTGYVLLTPNARLARRIKAEWDQRQLGAGRLGWARLPVFPLESWLLRQWQLAVTQNRLESRVILDPPRQQELWLKVIADDADANPNYSLLQPAAAAQLAGTAREDLLRWQVDLHSPANASEFSLDPDCATFLRWCRAFDARLRASGLETPAGCLRDLVGLGMVEQRTPVALLDFDDIPPLHRACLSLLATTVEELDTPGEAAPLQVLSFPDKSSELQQAARWAAQNWRDEPGATIGLVLQDMQRDRLALEYLLRREFNCLGDDYASLPVNFSTGISLDRAPVIRDALAILGSGERTVALADVIRLLQSRFTAHGDGQGPLAVSLLRALYRDGKQEIDTSRLRYRAGSVSLEEGGPRGLELGESLARVAQRRLHRQRLQPSAWAEEFCLSLQQWGWPGNALDSLEYQQVELWYRTLETFAGYDQVHGSLDYTDALRALRRCCEAQISQPQSADSRIQVLGPLEAAGLAFDKLRLCSLQAGQFPATARPNPFIPVSLQRTCDMPHASADREWRFADSLLRRFRLASAEVVASFSRSIDGVAERPSALLAASPVDAVDDPWSPPPAWADMREQLKLDFLDGDRPTPVSAAEAAILSGGSGILEDQSQCPFRAFARRRAGLEPLDELREGLSPADRGNLVHNALYDLWGRLGGRRELLALDAAERESLVADCAERAIDALPTQRRQLAGAACLELESERLAHLLLAWLELEAQREDFTVVAREADLSAGIELLNLQLRIDRIDELADGKRLLIDYKTGRSEISGWFGSRPSAVQLPLYASFSPVAGMAYGRLRAREPGFAGIGDCDGIPGVGSEFPKVVRRYSDAQSWEEQVKTWQEITRRLATEFIAGEAAVDPLRGACDYCGLQALCRVGQDVETGA